MQPTHKIWSECEYKSQQRFVSFFHSCWFCLLGLAWANDVFTQFFLCDNKTITLSLTAHTQTHKHIKCNKSEFTWTTPEHTRQQYQEWWRKKSSKLNKNWWWWWWCSLLFIRFVSLLEPRFFWYLNKVHIEAIKKIHFYSCQEELVLMGKKAMGMKSTLLPMSFAQVANMLLLLSTLLAAFFGRTIERIIRLSNCLPGKDKIERE